MKKNPILNQLIALSQELASLNNELNQLKSSFWEAQKNQIYVGILPGVFHKLKNKLTPILGFTQILKLKTEDPFFQERLAKIEANAEELTELLNILKNYFEPQATFRQPGNLNAILQNLKPTLTDFEKKQGVAISLELDERIPDDRLHMVEIQTLILNLVRNAATALQMKNPPGGRISIRTQVLPSGYRLLVKDNGIGIREEDKPQIWSPFFSRFPNQVGLGLTICEKIVTNHNGKISLNSKPGEYSEFEILFVPASRPSKMEADGSEKKRKIAIPVLLIDLEEYLIELLEGFLQTANPFEVTPASRRMVMDLVKNKSFGLYICNLNENQIPEEIMELLNERGVRERMIFILPAEPSTQLLKFISESQITTISKPLKLTALRNLALEKLAPKEA